MAARFLSPIPFDGGARIWAKASVEPGPARRWLALLLSRDRDTPVAARAGLGLVPDVGENDLCAAWQLARARGPYQRGDLDIDEVGADRAGGAAVEERSPTEAMHAAA
jgi:hypothetical protein